MTKTAHDRFWEKVQQGENGCWDWGASKNKSGYGIFGVNGRSKMAHRLAYEELLGPIPSHLELDHKCRHRACVNPDHLEAVTHQINVLRGEGFAAKHARKTHCPSGHPLSGVNLHTTKQRGRVCRSCKAIHKLAWKQRQREKA